MVGEGLPLGEEGFGQEERNWTWSRGRSISRGGSSRGKCFVERAPVELGCGLLDIVLEFW